LLAIEFIDELVGGVRAAAWPLIRRDLDLSYAEVGLVLAIPGLIGSAAEPFVGVLGDSGRRRAVIVAGGLAFALSAALTSVAVGFWTLLAAFVVGNPATSAFVSLSQASLMDLDPEAPLAEPPSGRAGFARTSVCAAGQNRPKIAHTADRRERGMAWWTLAGSLGYVGGPLLLATGLALGLGWRSVFLALAAVAVALTLAAGRASLPATSNRESLLFGVRGALTALRRLEVLRWLALLKSSDLLLDVFHGFLALYLVDVVGLSVADAALAVAVWTGAGLVGDALLIPLLRHVGGTAYLRASAIAVLAAYPAFLLVSSLELRLVLLAVLGLLNSGWYAIPKAGLYTALPGRSGAAVAVSGIAGLLHAGVPAALGVLAGAVGLGPTMWLLLLAPGVLLVLLPQRGPKVSCSP